LTNFKLMQQVILILVSYVLCVVCVNNGLGLTPPMGYNSWYDTQCSSQMNENLILETAQIMVSTGLDGLGYKYVNLDDCWAGGRYSNGTVYSDQTTFPSGIQALATKIHNLGLKFGLYTDRGTNTCAGRPGSLNYESIDAKTYAAWGVDYVKEDSCNAPNTPEAAFPEYGTMRDALNATGRPIYFSLCGWESWYAPVGYSLGNSWRIGGDNTNWPAVLNNINIDSQLTEYAHPGGWNDPCLLLGQTYNGQNLETELQSRAQFSMWAILAAPLLLSQNIRNLSAYMLETYSNTEIIAVNQDPLGIQGVRICGSNLDVSGTSLNTTTNIWARRLHDGGWAVAFINVGSTTVSVTCDSYCFGELGYGSSTTVNVRDLWAHQNNGTTTGATGLTIELQPAGGIAMLKFTL